MEEIVVQAEDWVKELLNEEKTGHDWHHIRRVTTIAKQIAIEENANLFVVTLASLFHDLADDKIMPSEAEGIQLIEKWLIEHQVDESTIAEISDIIKTISFSKGATLQSIEAKIVQDADRLDAIGAIGVARTFQYAGAKGHAYYDPTLSVRENMTKEEYRLGKTSAIHHFYEKLLKLKSQMHTNTAQKIAEERHQFMENFLEQFFHEWQSEFK
ncbi:uncharacterized protein JOC54_003314 [Alkalihalobacillus xiaoxiensis]|uniref:HD domain-containing protein n=1 Tax=Shouchella xiaoxiensis TaxID=766895 RepID=A0ABS2SWX5_9BACI|nr:HD domain-containing protein [Shouchella xiaoxiensis]MBM7840034.1 uncharacterized protein [Shouchella xiaoxiensis]